MPYHSHVLSLSSCLAGCAGDALDVLPVEQFTRTTAAYISAR